MKLPKIFIPEKDLDLKVAQLSKNCKGITMGLGDENFDIEDLLLQEYSNRLSHSGELSSTIIKIDYPSLDLSIVDRKVYACYDTGRESVIVHALRLSSVPGSNLKSDWIDAESYVNDTHLCAEKIDTGNKGKGYWYSV